ncbi:hypothetical protein AK812_SmicGene26881 [Symbiodinium microadriaticum]|uniref:Uncharacterized protein n=1 Tax=Symbiodinium microadriaticum TaxID=2951 RepID=A0A1Q9D867_SYMMI|nr:hypothetical protein AK812_SmicGene26881 [Symbiodinium microadriaticum]
MARHEAHLEGELCTIFPLQEVKVRYWTCKLCEYSKNTEDMTECKNCGRPRGYHPERYQQRLKEIRTWTEEDEPEEEGGIVEYCGLIVGLFILLLIIAILVWAYYQDQKAVDRYRGMLHESVSILLCYAMSSSSSSEDEEDDEAYTFNPEHLSEVCQLALEEEEAGRLLAADNQISSWFLLEPGAALESTTCEKRQLGKDVRFCRGHDLTCMHDCLCLAFLLAGKPLMGAPRAQSFAVAQGGPLAAPKQGELPRSQSFTAGHSGRGEDPGNPGNLSSAAQQDAASSNLPTAGPAVPLRPMELRELSTEVPREPSWPSDGPSSWKQAEASTPTSVSSRAQAAAGESHTSGTAQGSRSDNPAWEVSPSSKVEAVEVPEPDNKHKCTPKNPFWVQPEVIQKKPSSRRSRLGHHQEGCDSGAALLRCLSDVVDAGDRNHEIEIAEEELTTVHISSWEQRLDWRSFLSEAVASSLARQAFQNFDVEAEPPAYARPPPSSKESSKQQTGNRCVAPNGSGWMPS